MKTKAKDLCTYHTFLIPFHTFFMNKKLSTGQKKIHMTLAVGKEERKNRLFVYPFEVFLCLRIDEDLFSLLNENGNTDA